MSCRCTAGAAQLVPDGRACWLKPGWFAPAPRSLVGEAFSLLPTPARDRDPQPHPATLPIPTAGQPITPSAPLEVALQGGNREVLRARVPSMRNADLGVQVRWGGKWGWRPRLGWCPEPSFCL